MAGHYINKKWEYAIKISGQATGGTRRLFLTVAIFRSWRGSKGFAAPGLPGRVLGYSNWDVMSNKG